MFSSRGFMVLSLRKTTFEVFNYPLLSSVDSWDILPNPFSTWLKFSPSNPTFHGPI